MPQINSAIPAHHFEPDEVRIVKNPTTGERRIVIFGRTPDDRCPGSKKQVGLILTPKNASWLGFEMMDVVSEFNSLEESEAEASGQN